MSLPKHWLQFRLRSLLLVMFVTCLIARFYPSIVDWVNSRQTLPGPFVYPDTDDIQYFAPGPEFKLSREAAVQKPCQCELKEAEHDRFSRLSETAIPSE
ncbi:MAG TPA: hypothetical protein VMP01_20075 [Pirellulaceae bacterium]|nr:hypothetical protein [Pirellulaceae bacterium]